MFDTHIPVALIFYGKTRRRTEIPLDEELRALTLATIAAVREMKLSHPPPAPNTEPAAAIPIPSSTSANRAPYASNAVPPRGSHPN